MAVLNLENQAATVAAMQPKLLQLKNQLELRQPVFDRVSRAKKKAWIVNGNDPVMTLAYNMHTYLKEYFKDDDT